MRCGFTDGSLRSGSPMVNFLILPSPPMTQKIRASPLCYTCNLVDINLGNMGVSINGY